MVFEILQLQANISMTQRHFCLITVHDSIGHVDISGKPREETVTGSSLMTISVCQDVLNVKTGKYYPVVLLLEGPLCDCFKM